MFTIMPVCTAAPDYRSYDESITNAWSAQAWKLTRGPASFSNQEVDLMHGLAEYLSPVCPFRSSAERPN